MAVEVQIGAAFEPRAPRALFDTNLADKAAAIDAAAVNGSWWSGRATRPMRSPSPSCSTGRGSSAGRHEDLDGLAEAEVSCAEPLECRTIRAHDVGVERLGSPVELELRADELEAQGALRPGASAGGGAVGDGRLERRGGTVGEAAPDPRAAAGGPQADLSSRLVPA
jgi:hypothetical protein